MPFLGEIENMISRSFFFSQNFHFKDLLKINYAKIRDNKKLVCNISAHKISLRARIVYFVSFERIPQEAENRFVAEPVT